MAYLPIGRCVVMLWINSKYTKILWHCLLKRSEDYIFKNQCLLKFFLFFSFFYGGVYLWITNVVLVKVIMYINDFDEWRNRASRFLRASIYFYIQNKRKSNVTNTWRDRRQDFVIRLMVCIMFYFFCTLLSFLKAKRHLNMHVFRLEIS